MSLRSASRSGLKSTGYPNALQSSAGSVVSLLTRHAFFNQSQHKARWLKIKPNVESINRIMFSGEDVSSNDVETVEHVVNQILYCNDAPS